MNNINKYLMYVSLGLCSFAFAAAGAAKLAGTEQVLLPFSTMGIPLWFGYFVGASEVVGAIGLWIKKVSLYAALCLGALMCGAIYYHLGYDEPATVVPAIVLLALLAHIATSRLKQGAALSAAA